MPSNKPRYAVLIRKSAPTDFLEFLEDWAANTSDGVLVFSSKVEWGFPAVHLELLKDDEPPLPVQIPSEFVLAIVDLSISHPSFGFLKSVRP